MSQPDRSAHTAFNCDFEAAEDIKLRCLICRFTMLRPVSLQCGHSGCLNCLQTLAKERGPTCPTCYVAFDVQALSISFVLNDVTSSLPVRCINKDCKWTGAYENAPDHFAQCPKVEIECPNDECRHVELREHMATHSATCVKRKLPCPDCNKSVMLESLTNHRTEDCPNPSTECPLSCGVTISRSSILLHLQQCKEKAVKCKVDGCGRLMRRKDMGAHVKEAAASHYSLQSEEVQRLRRVIYEKRCNKEALQLKEERMVSFVWKIENFPDCIRQQRNSGNVPLTSDTFHDDGRKWRGLLASGENIYLQLLASANPVTAKIRIVLMPGETQQATTTLAPTTFKEGGMWGINKQDINRWVNEDGRLSIKFNITHLSL